jgi:hypothetical protein
MRSEGQPAEARITSIGISRANAWLVLADRHVPAVATLPTWLSRSLTHRDKVSFDAHLPMEEMNKNFSPNSRLVTEKVAYNNKAFPGHKRSFPGYCAMRWVAVQHFLIGHFRFSKYGVTKTPFSNEKSSPNLCASSILQE